MILKKNNPEIYSEVIELKNRLEKILLMLKKLYYLAKNQF